MESTVSAEHDRQFFDTFMIVLGALVAFTLLVYFLANAIHARTQGAYIEENPLKAEQIAARLAPVTAAAEPMAAPAAVPMAPAPATAPAPVPAEPAPAAVTAAVDAEAVYNSACMACHTLGVAGAPKHEDVEAWAPRIARGIDTLYANAINGYQGEAGIMPAKGGRLDLSDDEVKAAVDFMVDAAQ